MKNLFAGAIMLSGFIAVAQQPAEKKTETKTAPAQTPAAAPVKTEAAKTVTAPPTTTATAIQPAAPGTTVVPPKTEAIKQDEKPAEKTTDPVKKS